jgi:hypothetical protein
MPCHAVNALQAVKMLVLHLKSKRTQDATLQAKDLLLQVSPFVRAVNRCSVVHFQITPSPGIATAGAEWLQQRIHRRNAGVSVGYVVCSRGNAIGSCCTSPVHRI